MSVDKGMEAFLDQHMKDKVDAVINGVSRQENILGGSISSIVNYLESLGGSYDKEFETNGWQWDYWVECYYKGTVYQISGSGYYGNCRFTRIREEEDE